MLSRSSGAITGSGDTKGAISTNFKESDNVLSTTNKDAPENSPPLKVIWYMVVSFALLHSGSLIALYLACTSASWKTIIFAAILWPMSGLGITAGNHRLWAHRAYKAKLPLRIFLAFLSSMALQRDIFWWTRDHRVHHKHSDTNADPYNAKRGFFFSHIGWLMVRKHPDVIEKGKTIDVSDLLADPVVRFQKRYYIAAATFCCFVVPTTIPMMLWDENLLNSCLIPGVLRLVFVHHCTFLVNSAAHMWGNRPYDIRIEPRENFWVTLLAIGEGFHNYHHTFPWDYACNEYGISFNFSTAFINFMVSIGLAYDIKTAPREMIRKTSARTGEKS